MLDGRDITVPGYENGYFVGSTILDHVKPGMTIGDREIFGPVTAIKRVKDFDEGLAVMNAKPFANGSVIFTQNGYYARQFELLTDGGMVSGANLDSWKLHKLFNRHIWHTLPMCLFLWF